MFPFVGIARRGGNRITGTVSADLSALLAGGEMAISHPQFSAALAALAATGSVQRTVKGSLSAALAKVAASGSVKRTIKSSSMSAALAKVAASGTLNSYPQMLDKYDPTTNLSSISVTSSDNQGQAITLAQACPIKKASFSLYKYNSPTGNLYAKIYAATGTVGTNAKPTGSALATSGSYSISSLSTSAAWVTFTFSTAYSASAGNYVIVLNSDTAYNYPNIVYAQMRYSTAGDHAGNSCSGSESGWSGPYHSTDDLLFKLESS